MVSCEEKLELPHGGHSRFQWTHRRAQLSPKTMPRRWRLWEKVFKMGQKRLHSSRGVRGKSTRNGPADIKVKEGGEEVLQVPELRLPW